METEGFSSHSGFIKCFPFLIFSILCICKGTIGQIYTCLTTLERELRRKPSHLRQDLSSAVRRLHSWCKAKQSRLRRWCRRKLGTQRPGKQKLENVTEKLILQSQWWTTSAPSWGQRTCYAWQAVGNRWGSLAKSSRSQEHGVLWCLEHWLQLGKPKPTSCGGRVHTAHYLSAKIRFRLVHSMVDLLPDQVKI